MNQKEEVTRPRVLNSTSGEMRIHYSKLGESGVGLLRGMHLVGGHDSPRVHSRIGTYRNHLKGIKTESATKMK